MQDNTKSVAVKMTARRCFRTEPIYQYDVGHVLTFDGFELPAAFEVHFARSPLGKAITQIGTDGTCTLPDMFAQTAGVIYAWLYIADADSGLTKYSVEIPVAKRAQITDQEPTPVEQSAIDQAIAALNAGVEAAEDAQEAAEAAQASAESYAESAGQSAITATNAANSATSAKTAAETAARNAAASATDAHTSREAADQSATNAGVSERNAAASASAAAGSATSAATSAGQASSSATAASGSASTASTKASEAAQSATAAAGSAASASEDAGTASTAATAAGQSATAAAGSATAAAGSATSAGQSATAAAGSAQAAQDVLDSIPADYSELSGDVDNLKSAINVLDDEMDMLITKTPRPTPPPTEIIQVCDLSNATKRQRSSTQKYYWEGIKIDLPWNGYYYLNPTGIGVIIGYLKAYNASGQNIQLYRNGVATGQMNNIDQERYIEKVDARTIKLYTSNGTLDWTYTTNEDIAYLAHPGSAYIQGTTDENQLVGLTYGGQSETYIPYGESEQEDQEVEYDYNYNDDVAEFVKEYFDENYTDTNFNENSDNYVTNKLIASSLLKDSYNLIDPNWFDWEHPGEQTSGSVTMKTGIYFPVMSGEYLICNCEKVGYTFYDSNKTQVGSKKGTAIAYAEVEVPDDVSYARAELLMGTGYIPADHAVVVYYSSKADSPRDDIRPFLPHKNLQGMRGSSEIFDYYAPSALDKEILQMAKYSAVRNMNFCNNTVRIGTFNMYNPRLDYGWETVKKMFADYAIDVVGFQEVTANHSRVWTEYLKGWQFTDGKTDTPVAVASHFKILSYNTYTTEVTGRKFMRCVIQLPRYADAVNPTISVYTYHGIWDGGTVQKRVQEIEEILAVIANDTSDFIVVVGDTNADAPHTEWDTWKNAGFNPVHDGVGVNTTTDNPPLCLDNIFYGAGISCKSYHVVPSRDYMITQGGQEVPLSDHDMVFADLQFDFDSLLAT